MILIRSMQNLEERPRYSCLAQRIYSLKRNIRTNVHDRVQLEDNSGVHCTVYMYPQVNLMDGTLHSTPHAFVRNHTNQQFTVKHQNPAGIFTITVPPAPYGAVVVPNFPFCVIIGDFAFHFMEGTNLPRRRPFDAFNN